MLKKSIYFIALFSLLATSGATYSTAHPKRGRGTWTNEQDNLLREAVEQFKGQQWKKIAESVGEKSAVQCLQRWKKVLMPGLKKGKWNHEEIEALQREIQTVMQQGSEKIPWPKVAKKIPGRTAKQCREKWFSDLDPTIKKTPWSEEEDQTLNSLIARLGQKWAFISKSLPGRTENMVKAHFQSLQRKQRKESKLDDIDENIPGMRWSDNETMKIKDEDDEDDEDDNSHWL